MVHHNTKLTIPCIRPDFAIAIRKKACAHMEPSATLPMEKLNLEVAMLFLLVIILDRALMRKHHKTGRRVEAQITRLGTVITTTFTKPNYASDSCKTITVSLVTSATLLMDTMSFDNDPLRNRIAAYPVEGMGLADSQGKFC
jgi:hypothetical protein